MEDEAPGGGYFIAPPSNYVIPNWPGLYLPWKDPSYLYYPSSIWRFTIYWSLLLSGGAFLLCGLWACLIFARRSRKHLKYAIWLPLGYVTLGSVVSFITGTVIGFALAACYNAAYLRMSTWVPFLWASAQTLVVVIGSYSTITFLL
ncbi:MAG: hypothetical protein CYPHOPRED_001363 [Cyphobasidiales sp. Tagirdzhanova-0007]|nr:MAG: hypothetical protein CYPHOPRED_001363 [Cyphobasidiales sp. Tagirdzhanova-0007]